MQSSRAGAEPEMPVVSVVMPVYNARPFLGEAIQSVIEQSFDDFEFIVVDDGSTDGSQEILSGYALRDSRIKVVHQEHAGVVPALNRGCNLAKGQYIARLDSDDVAKPWRFKEQVSHMHDHQETVLLGGSTECIDHEGKVNFVMHWPGFDGALYDYLLIDCHIAHTTVMFRREVFITLGGYRSCFVGAEDYDLFLRISDAHIVDNLPMILCQYRVHDMQVSAQTAGQQILSGIGAKLATKERRANRPEPELRGNCITREDLIAQGVRHERIDSLISEYLWSNANISRGWRWSKSQFCELAR